MVKYIRYLLPFVILISASCTKFTAPERFEGEVYSLAGLLVAGKSISVQNPVYITRSTTIEAFDPLSLFVTDAIVTVKDLSNPAQWTLSVYNDSAEMKVKYIDPADHIIQPEHRYRIEIQIPGHTQLITAETTVPAQAQLIPDYLQNNIPAEGYSLTETPVSTLKYDDIDIKYPLAMNTGAFSGACNFMAEMYCMEDFSTELEFTNPIFGIEHPDAEMEDAYNAGGESIRRIQFIGRYISQPQNGSNDNYLLIKDYRQAFVFFGRYQITLWIADDNYYKYTYMPEGYFHGGVNGALGFFGSVAGGTMYAKIVK
ncbi:MAG: hypothetical protein CVU50_02610 [Candidatus Cloacimonetes bacterium HGW-Cloacimonetes-3]|jgi:hypothetical protein|nr:MAG: hypothetical protein CVU50_02610 [Candidatus Cloacimonetes bacterium HGW-Cloacimonetes-3]